MRAAGLVCLGAGLIRADLRNVRGTDICAPSGGVIVTARVALGRAGAGLGGSRPESPLRPRLPAEKGCEVDPALLQLRVVRRGERVKRDDRAAECARHARFPLG